MPDSDVLSFRVARPHLVHVAFVQHAAVGATIGVLATTNGTIVAAVIGGCFTLVNTGLTVWLTGSRGRKQHRRRRKAKSEDKR